MKRMVLLVLALTIAAGCTPSFRTEAEAAYRGYLVIEVATEPVRDFDADGDGNAEDPSETRAHIELLRRSHRQLMREFVKVNGGDPDAVEAALAARLGGR